MFTFIKKQIDSPTLYQGLMLYMWRIQNKWKRTLLPQKTLKRGPWAPLFVIIYWILLYLFDGLKTNHVVLALIVLGLYNWNVSTKRFIKYFFPLVLTGLIYDSMRLYVDILRGPVHVAEPYLWEKALFGINDGASIITPNEYLATRTSSFLDLLCGFAYLTFTIEYVLFAFFLYASNMYLWVKKMNWSYLMVNIMGFITYHLYAAAPPWYVKDYGMGAADLTAPPSAAGAARFDELLGTSFFEAMYGSNANIFGAIPSLHVTYPFLAMVMAFQIGRFRSFSVFYAVLMCFSAVYLYHHYIIDVIWGIAYALITAIVIEQLYKRKIKKAF